MTMRIHTLADLHGEFIDHHLTKAVNPVWWPLTKVGADVVVLAGDIHLGTDAIHLAAQLWPQRQVVIVAGNHEFYGSEYHQALADLRQTATVYPNIHFLENDMVEINDVVFLGCTLWSDFCLYGKQALHTCQKAAAQYMADYRHIRNNHHQPISLLRPEDTAAFHLASVKWLDDCLTSLFKDKHVVVVTHAAPSEHSVPEQYKGAYLSAAFSSNLEWLIEKHQPELWLHGHTHGHCDYLIGKTRVIGNPKGYPEEVTAFQPELVVDV